MDADFQIDRELNRMIGRVTEKGDIRQRQLKGFPLCLLYGEVPEEIRESLRTELAARTGNLQAAELAAVPCAEEMEAAVTAAAHLFQERIGSGALSSCRQLFLAFFFMADRLDTADVQRCQRLLPELMLRLGYRGEYEVCYYCIFDYETMREGGRYKRALEELLQNEDTCFPLGVFTHTWGAAPGERYRKAVQAIAMHIFLRCVQEAVPDYAVFTLAYWKRDVLKNGIADYLIQALEAQGREQEPEADYNGRIARAIDRITDFPVKRYREMFPYFPVCTDKLKKGRYSERELSELLYGSGEAFRAFLAENAGERRDWEELFSGEDLGNLYEVRNRLKRALQRYGDEKEEQLRRQTGDAGLRQTFRVGGRPKIGEILDGFAAENGCWAYEGRQFLLEYKIEAARAAAKRLGSEQFERGLREKENAAKTQINRLRLIQRESLSLEGDSRTGGILSDLFEDRNSRAAWNRAIWSEDHLRHMEEKLGELYVQASSQLRQNQEQTLGEYAQRLRELKSLDALGAYYAARMDTPGDNREEEFLYAGGISANVNPRDLQTLLRTHLPRVEVRSREWEPDTCLELLAVREISDLSELYAMDEGW